MPSDLSSYLATHYLTTDAKPSKKRKRKHATDSNAGLLITDDDESGWAQPGRSNDDNDNADADNPVTVAGTSAEFRRAKKSSWKTVGAPVPAFSETKDGRGGNEEAAAADAILASAAAENAAAAARDDEAPVVEGGGGADMQGKSSAMMSDGTHAGLQSAAAISAQLKRRQQEEREELAALNRERKARAKRKGGAAGDEEDEEEQLVLRDATGRRIDVAMRRAEARRAAVDAEEQARRDEAAKKRALKGDVQLEQARERRERLEDAAVMPLARGKDDEEMNEELKAQARWNDPMAQFLDTGAGGGGKSGGKSKKGSKSGRPVYKGAAPPNRYGIRPGYRWDGVDRSNGFEGERFKAINRRERVKGLDYSWQMDE